MDSPPIAAKKVPLLGIELSVIDMCSLEKYIEQCIDQKQRAIIANVNIHAMNLAFEQAPFRSFLNASDVVFCDGFGVKWGARLAGQKLGERFTPPDWLRIWAGRCPPRSVRFYLLGGKPEVVERCAEVMQKECPGFEVVGFHHGYFDKKIDSEESCAVIQDINNCEVDVLMVGLGMPLQEQWIEENWSFLNSSVALPVGAAIDYFAGEVYRAPRWITGIGLEWLARLVVEPRRLWRRYLIGNFKFFYRLIKSENSP